MENNNANPATGSKGVFPEGNVPQVAPSHTGPQNTAPENQTQNTAPAPAPEPAPVTADTKTYIRLETKNPEGQVSGVLEIDLISFRERGQESRYLSINTVGAGQDGGQSDTTISIDNEADFNRFKDFISKLNWND